MMDEQQDNHAAALALAGDIRILAGQLKRRLREKASFGDFTESQVSVLSRLERDGPASCSALARAEGVRPQSLGATVAVLEAAGLVAGTPDPADRRQTLLLLTDACREKVAASRAAREDWLLRAIEAKFTAEEQAQLAVGTALLKRLVET